MDSETEPQTKSMRLTLSRRLWRRLARRAVDENLSVPALMLQIVCGRIPPLEGDD